MANPSPFHTLKMTIHKTCLISALLCLTLTTQPLWAESDREQELEEKVKSLTLELEKTKRELLQARQKYDLTIAEKTEPAQPPASSEQSDKIKLGPLSIGGAIRANYVHGDYVKSGDAPQRGGNGGNFELGIFRLNASLAYQQIIGEFEYRWYDGYNFLHTGWLGYDFEDSGEVQVGLTRVPFGPGPYGVSQSWFFDQHFYVGLADDMDLGVKYLTERGNFELALAFFISSENNGNGGSADSARYGYDVVEWRSEIRDDGELVSASNNGYQERNQFNTRLIYHFKGAALATDLGLSLQAGELDGKGVDDGDHWAASLHMTNHMGNFTLASQITRFEMNIDSDNALGSSELIPMGAYDFAWPTATEAWVPAVSLSYLYAAPTIPWLDSVLPYIEYSGIIKDYDSANDSELITIGAAWASGGWYIYTDYARSNGNLFVGDKGDNYSNIFEGVGDFGANGNNRWSSRFNANFGYYF